MTKPREALDEAGAQTKIVSLKPGKIQRMNHTDKGDKFEVDLAVKDASPKDDFVASNSGRHAQRTRKVGR